MVSDSLASAFPARVIGIFGAVTQRKIFMQTAGDFYRIKDEETP